MILVGICLISLLIAIPGFINKAGYSFVKGLIPGYNIYLFLSLLEFSPLFLIIISIGLIVLPDRAYFATLLFMILPFMVSDAFGKGKFTGFLILFLPFIMYPFLGYIGGTYAYDVREGKVSFIKEHKVLSFVVLILAVFVYSNFTRIIEGNYLVDKDSEQYVNEIYMSDGRIYDNYLNNDEKKIYMMMLNSAKEGKSLIEIKYNDLECSDWSSCNGAVANAHDGILVDHPELITYATGSYKDVGDGIDLRLQFAKSNIFAVRLGEMQITRIIDKIKRDTKDMNDLDKIVYVYDWIGQNNVYDKTFTWTSKNQSLYNVFIHGNAVCAGFAKASQVIFQNIGINSYIIRGQTSGPHMWNVVEYNGKNYYYDSTVATSAQDQEKSWYYDGLIQEEMSDYIPEHRDWYPEISQENGLLQKKDNQ